LSLHDENILSEGLFDAQLSLPIPGAAHPEPFSAVLKRDGRREPFDKAKIAGAIFNAAQAVGGQDRDLANSLASAVSIFLWKRHGSQPPTVDQVHDAVERVLIEMSHAKTALAYARYRDRRARIRRIREGDLRLLMSELEEANHLHDAMRGDPSSLFVRTSADTVTHWERDRIVEALVRETGLDRAIAELIAGEVERQIHAGGITALTSSLIRELVGAKLIEHGLESHRDRHRRLGLPLYDTARIVRGLSPEAIGKGPSGTGEVLARTVKKEYALAEVFSPIVAEAHLRGDIHLHGLGEIDRLYSARGSVGPIVRSGLDAIITGVEAPPPEQSEALLAQWSRAAVAYGRLFSGGIQSCDLGIELAALAGKPEDSALKQLAAMVLYEFAATASGPQPPAADIELDISLYRRPRHDETPNAPFLNTAAERFGAALLEHVARVCDAGALLTRPLLRLDVTPAHFRDFGAGPLLRRGAQLAAVRGPIRFVFVRDGMQPATTPATLQLAMLNLPRAAFRAGNESGALEVLRHQLEIVATAHREKTQFIDSLWSRGPEGPLGLLAHTRSILDIVPGNMPTLVAVTGLAEAVRYLSGGSLHDAADGHALGIRILEHLRATCKEIETRTGAQLLLTQDTGNEAAQRFAALDLAAFPLTADSVILWREAREAPAYTLGTQLRPEHGGTAFENARAEGALCACLDAPRACAVRLPKDSLSAESIQDFLHKTFHLTNCPSVELI